MEKRPRRRVGRPSKKKTEAATQQYKVADIDPHNYDVFETRCRQYMAKPSHTGEKWSVKFGGRSAPVSPKDTSDMDTDEGQLITQQVLQTTLEHERKRQRSQRLQRPRFETDFLYEEILPEQTVLPGPFESILNKEEKDLEKMGDSKIRAEMTMPKSPIMGEAAQAKSEQEEKESLVSAMVEDIKAEKERGIEQSLPLERTIVQAGVDFDRRCEEASARERDTIKWPPAMVYGIMPQTSSGEENRRQCRETPPVLDYYGFSPKVTQTPALFTSAVQGTSAFVVPAKKALTQVSDSDKESVSGRAPLLLTPAFEEEKVEKPLVRADILTPTKLTKDGNPAVIVKTDSWYDAYKTQYFAVDKVNGTIYAIKEDGQWEPTEERATIDAETHNILMSTTPLAGNKMGRQSLSTGITPGNKTEDSLPLAESTRTPGHQRIYPRDKDLTASAQRKRTIDNLSGQLMRDLIDEAMQEEQDFIIQELKAAEEAEQKALQEAQALKEQQFQLKLQLEAEQKIKQEEARLQLEHEQRQKLLEEEEKKLAEQKRITAELKLQKEKERLEREELEKQLEYAKQREAAIEQEFRDRLSSVGSDKSLKEASIGKLTERQIAGTQIKREQLQGKLRRITEAFKYVQATGTKVSDETLQRYEQIRKKIARELRLCL